MPKEKIIEKTTEAFANKTNILVQYAPLVLGLICLIICYLLFKKIQSLNSHSDSISKLEKQFTGFVKEQSELNAVNNKKFNGMISQINQIGYIIQNSNNREVNSVNTQMSPERSTVPEQQEQQHQEQQQQPQHQEQQQREMMPMNTVKPTTKINSLPPPMNTSTKKENLIRDVDNVKHQNKKVINIQTLQEEEVLIEEASSDDEN